MHFFFKVKGIEFKTLCLLEPTSPLTEIDICNAYKVLDDQPEIDSIVGVGVTESQNPKFCFIKDNIFIKPYVNFENKNLRRQDIKQEVLFLDGLYIYPR